MQCVAASGGFWLLCSADEAFCLETSLVGSVGVVMAGFGLKVRVYVYVFAEQWKV